MRTIVFGDIHGRTSWKKVVENLSADRAIFVGDYFDSREDISTVEQMRNFEDIIHLKKSSPKEVILLIGNHDHHYFPEVGYTGTSGYQSGGAHNISFLLNENRDLLQMCYQLDNFLFSHAGIGKTFLEENNWKDEKIDNFLNDLWKYQPKRFCFTGFERTGDDITQTPIWIRPKSLIKDSKNLGFKQVVGHTSMEKMDLDNYNKYGYYFIDTLGTSGEYLIIEDKEIKIGKVI